MNNQVPEEPRPYTPAERRTQLEAMADLSSRMAAIAAPHDPYLAESLRARAEQAAVLLREGFVQAQLNDLGYLYPAPAWLDSRHLEHHGSREPWQEQIANLHPAAQRTALELRAVARVS